MKLVLHGHILGDPGRHAASPGPAPTEPEGVYVVLWLPGSRPLCQGQDPRAASPGFGLGPTLSPACRRSGRGCFGGVGPRGRVPPLSFASGSLSASFLLQISFLRREGSMAAIAAGLQFLLHPQRRVAFLSPFSLKASQERTLVDPERAHVSLGAKNIMMPPYGKGLGWVVRSDVCSWRRGWEKGCLWMGGALETLDHIPALCGGVALGPQEWLSFCSRRQTERKPH